MPAQGPAPDWGQVDVVVHGSYFEGTCAACVEPPERGGVVVVVRFGTQRRYEDRAEVTLCPGHYNALFRVVKRTGQVRDI